MVPNSIVMTVAAIFKSRLLKWLLKETFIYLCYWVEVASKIKHAVTTYVNTSNGIRSQLFNKKNRGMRLKLSSAPLTLKWSRYCALLLVVKGGSLWTLTQKSTFPNEFLRWNTWATDRVIQKNHKHSKKNRKSDMQLQNGGQKNNFKLAT